MTIKYHGFLMRLQRIKYKILSSNSKELPLTISMDQYKIECSSCSVDFFNFLGILWVWWNFCGNFKGCCDTYRNITTYVGISEHLGWSQNYTKYSKIIPKMVNYRRGYPNRAVFVYPAKWKMSLWVQNLD